MHGIAQVGEKALKFDDKGADKKIFKLLKWALVFVFCNVAWVFFRADSFTDALTVFYRIWLCFADISTFTYSTIQLSNKRALMILFLIGILTAYDYLSLKQDVIRVISEKTLALRWSFYLLLVVGTFFVYSTMALSDEAFVYFQF